MTPRHPPLLCAAFALALAGPATAVQNHTLSPIAIRGAPAPETATTFAGFELPISITDSGVAFVANLTSVSGSGDAVYAELGSGLQLVALAGTPAPGIPGMTLVDVKMARLNAAGSVVYVAATWDGIDGVEALYRWTGGAPTVLVKTGDPAPGPGLSFSGLNVPSQNDAGDVAFVGQTDDAQGSYLEGIFELSGGVVTPRVWEETTAPRTGDGTLRSFGSPVLNASGDLAFAASVSGGSVDDGLFRISGGILETLVLEGDVLPGTGGGTADWLTFSRIDMNAAGTVAFVADVVGGSVDRGIFTISGGVISPVALEGDPAPNAGGAVFDFLRRHIAIDDAGEVAYRADLTGGSASQGLFRSDAAVALIGEPLPGTGGGSIGTMSEQPATSAAGAVGFQANIFQGVGGWGLFRATPNPEAVPTLPAFTGAALAILLAGLGARRLAN